MARPRPGGTPPPIDPDAPCAWPGGCTDERVGGSQYCEDHLLQSQVMAQPPAPEVGTLAALIRRARKQGLLKPVSSYAGN